MVQRGKNGDTAAALQSAAMDPFRRVQVRESDFDAEWLRGVAPMLSVTVGLAIRKVGE